MASARSSPETRARWLFAAVLLVGAIAIAAWYRVTSARSVMYELRTSDNVSGLMVDAPVEFHGVEIGTVAAVELVDPATVRVLLRLRHGAPVSGATVATITSRGLASKGFTGYVYVALEDEGRQRTPLANAAGPAYPRIRTAASRSMNLDTAMSQVNANVQSVTHLLQATLDEHGIAALKETLGNLRTVTRSLADNSERMQTVAVNLERASRRLGPLLDAGADSARTLRTRVLPQASQAFIAVGGASRTWAATGERAGRGLDPLLATGRDSAVALQTQLLPQAYEAVGDLQRLTTTLDGLAQRLERDPSLLLRGATRRPPGPGETP